MKRYNLYWKSLESVDKKKGVICGLGYMWLKWDMTE